MDHEYVSSCLLWCRGVVVITTAQLHSTKPELRLCAGSNPARGVSEIRDGEDLWQWSQLEIRLNAFCQSTIPQKQFIIIIIMIKYEKHEKYLSSNPFVPLQNFVWYKVQIRHRHFSSTVLSNVLYCLDLSLNIFFHFWMIKSNFHSFF